MSYWIFAVAFVFGLLVVIGLAGIGSEIEKLRLSLEQMFDYKWDDENWKNNTGDTPWKKS
jgi:hypothetical protein